jgi:hypothetical protein
MNEAKPLRSHSLIKEDMSSEVPVDVPYRELIDSLVYLATVIRPDVSFAGEKLASKDSRHSRSG